MSNVRCAAAKLIRFVFANEQAVDDQDANRDEGQYAHGPVRMENPNAQRVENKQRDDDDPAHKSSQ
jgi:hypothetical protein